MKASLRQKILTYGNPALRKKATPVDEIDDSARSLACDMLSVMAAAEGIGLAAAQLGNPRSICVVNVPAEHDANDDGKRLNPDLAMPLIMINPEVKPLGKRRESRGEGCLSFPGITATVVRHYRVTAKFMDLEGRCRQIDACDLVARAIQHEVDHLNGVLLVDRMSAVKRVSLSGQLKRLKSDNA